MQINRTGTILLPIADECVSLCSVCFHIAGSWFSDMRTMVWCTGQPISAFQYHTLKTYPKASDYLHWTLRRSEARPPSTAPLRFTRKTWAQATPNESTHRHSPTGSEFPRPGRAGPGGTARGRIQVLILPTELAK